MEKRSVHWGILSTARIGVNKVIPALQLADCCEVHALASRTVDRARAAAEQLKIPQAYGSYEELLSDPEVDAIYNPLPNHLHVPWSIRCLEAGKHVLCEKPISLTADEAVSLVQAAQRQPHLKVMEAFMYRLHPQWQLARELVAAGRIGQLQTVQTFFSFFNNDAHNIRNQSACGGGALLDIGCYGVSLSRFIFADEPVQVLGYMEFDPVFHTDRLTSAVMQFKHGTSTFTCATQLAPYQRVNIMGTEGRIEIMIPFNAPADEPCAVWHHWQDKSTKITLETCNQYTIQGELFAQAVLNDASVPIPLSDAVANMRVLDAIQRSAQNGAWVKVEPAETEAS